VSVSFNYSHTVNNQNITLARFREVFPNVPSPDNVTVQIPINLSSSDYLGLSISAPVKINKWWNMINNGNMYYEKFNGNFGGTVLSNGRPAMDIRTNNTFTLKNGWTAELNAAVNTGGQYGFMVLDPQWSLSAGVQKRSYKTKEPYALISPTYSGPTCLSSGYIQQYVEKWRHTGRRGLPISVYYRSEAQIQGAGEELLLRRRTPGAVMHRLNVSYV
jgi:hypothetical protein